jgi:hypothetical protein
MEQNLLKYAAKNEADVDRSAVKIAVIGFLGVVLAAAVGFFTPHSSLETSYLLMNFLGITAFLVVILLQTFFVKSPAKLAALALLYALALIAPQIKMFSVFTLAQGLVVFGGIFWGNMSGRKELRDRMKINFLSVSRPVLKKTISGLALFVILFYAEAAQQGGFIISKPLFEQLLFSGGGAVERFYGGVSLTDNAQAAISKIASNQAKAISGFDLLPPAMQREILSKTAKDLEERFAQILGVPIQPQSRVIDLLYDAFDNRFKNLGDVWSIVALLALVFLGFLTLRSVGMILAWVVILVGFIAYEILLALGFATVVLESTSREIIIL